jgi:hypothetical protein
MTETRIKILAAAWLGLGGIFVVLAFIAVISVVQGGENAAFESGDKWWIVVLILLVVAAIPMVNGLALLRRNAVARPLIAISSLVLLVPSLASVFPLLVVVPSLWLTLSKGGKEALRSYMRTEHR